MSRDLTTDFRNSIMAGTVKPLLMVTAFFDSETLRFWNGTQPFEYGGNTFTGAGFLLTISDITETQKTEARGIEFSLSGIPTSMISIALAEDYQGREIRVDFATVDLLAGNVISNPYPYFEGYMDVMEIEEGRETSTIKLSAEHHLDVLKRNGERRRTTEDQKLKYPNDKFFDQVATNVDRQIVWGKGQ